ncbi:hypothetical protein CSUI_007355 [Cystoisospora suis]|uniref:Uncharacterized protein n=1 Tax=Cystoisospora suis TaxID=483139 RepID=A0A2C6KMR2_9APIC|nr:hypothetical protein CSUI_007355 [Cystoisospora suis]
MNCDRHTILGATPPVDLEAPLVPGMVTAAGIISDRDWLPERFTKARLGDSGTP